MIRRRIFIPSTQPVVSGGLSRVWERNHILLDCQTSDRSPGDLVCGPLKEVQEERPSQRVIRRMERLPYVRDDALHKIPLLLEGLLNYRIGGLRVLA